MGDGCRAARTQASKPSFLCAAAARLTARIAVRLFRFEQEEFASIAITETAQARADAKRVQLDEMRARALAQHQSELTVVLNEDRRVVYASAALEPITGEQAFDVLGSPFEFILDQPSRIEFRRAVDRILREQPGDRQIPSLLLRTRAALAGTRPQYFLRDRQSARRSARAWPRAHGARSWTR